MSEEHSGADTEETEFQAGESELSDLDEIKLGHDNPYASQEEEEDEETAEDAGESDSSEGEDERGGKEGSSDHNYKELQRSYGESREEVKLLKDLNSKFDRFGGLEKALNALEFVSNDPDFKELAARKSRGDIPGLDEKNMSPEAKKALELVRQTARQEVDAFRKEHKSEISDLLKNVIEPEIAANREIRMEKLAEQMTDMFGEVWLEQVESMTKLGDTISSQVAKNPKIGDLEDLFYKSLRIDGKLDAFLAEKGNKAVMKRKKLSVNRQRSSDTRPKSIGKPKDMTEAAMMAERKLR